LLVDAGLMSPSAELRSVAGTDAGISDALREGAVGVEMLMQRFESCIGERNGCICTAMTVACAGDCCGVGVARALN
jgi:hypothetical protein